MAGGGADGYELFETLLRAFPSLTADRPCVLVVVTGPFLPEAERRSLQQLSAGLPVHLVSHVDDSLSYQRAADLVIAMAGYNTTVGDPEPGRRGRCWCRAGGRAPSSR